MRRDLKAGWYLCAQPHTQAPCAPHIYANANGSIRRLGDIETLGLVLSCSPSLGSLGTLDGCILGLVRRSGSSWTQWSQQNIAVVGRNILVPGRIFNCFFPSCRLDRLIWSDQTMKLNISQIEARHHLASRQIEGAVWAEEILFWTNQLNPIESGHDS